MSTAFVKKVLGTCVVLLGVASFASAANLVESLTKFEAKYEWNDVQDRYIFSKKAELEPLLSAHPFDLAVRVLVNCLDQTTPSETTINDQPVPVGVICHEALTELVSYEPKNKTGEKDRNWPGHVTPMATANDLHAAKNAWKPVVEKKLYVKL
jgi:hypothetical protein